MDNKNRLLLQHYQQDIIKDLDVIYILDELFTKGAVSAEDFYHIYSLQERSERTRYLLDKLLQSSNVAFEVFVDSLAKDYKWLWEKFAISDNKEMVEDSFEDNLSRGDVPRQPHHFVRRLSLESELLKSLQALTRHKILVLHGMSGCGKTSLAISVLRNNSKLITEDFNGVVYWLNLGDCKTDDDIIVQQNKLYRKVSSLSLYNSHMNSSISMSSIGSNADSLSNYDITSWQDLKDKLKLLFAEQSLKDSLLVLDEVNKMKCIDAFDIGCKMLVTTRDTGVVTNFHPQILKVENHFSEKESLELFASYLDVEVKDLPRQAKKLHEICKGSPFHIALIGAELAENKEKLVHDSRQWNYYTNKLEKKEFIFNISRPNGNPMKPIEMCINSLKSDILPLFKMLTILPDNVKLSVKVFSKLWNKSIIEVDRVLKQLRNKSLIIQFFDKDQSNYTYEIHDLIMGYLRTSASVEEVKKLHTDFLNSYNYNNNAPVEIEDDGYIAFYIGYHLANTKNLYNRWSLFNKLYLNLKFLGNKVRLTGPADVISDLQKYESYIANDEIDKSLLYSIKEYLSTHGIDLYRYPCTDIIQSILQNESKGILYTKAWQIAQERCDKKELYFEFLHEQNVEEIKHATIDVKETITSVCFLGDYVLVGTVTGVIKFFHIGTNILKKELQSTESPIIWLDACPVNPLFIASLDKEGVIKLWYIDDVEQEGFNNDDIIEEEAEEAYNNNYPSNTTITPKLGKFISCRWSNNNETLITHTTKMIVFYNTSGKVLEVLDNLYRERNLTCCIPCDYDKHVIVATSNSSNTVDIVNVKTKEKQTFQENDVVLDIVTIPGSNKILTLKENEVTQYEFKTSRIFNLNCNNCNYKPVITSDMVKENVKFISMVVNKNGTLLFISTDDSRVICVDLKTSAYIFDLENRRGNVVSMSMSEVAWVELSPGPDVLVTGTAGEENCAKVWYLDAAYVAHNTHTTHGDNNGKVRLTTKFDASFINSLSPQTPNTLTPNSVPPSTHNSPRRHQSFANHNQGVKKIVKTTMSLDRHSLKPLNLKGICNGNSDSVAQPLLAIIDDKNNIQVMRGRKLITEITSNCDEQITSVQISPCNQHILYGLKSGIVRKFSLRSKETHDVMDVNSAVQYMNFVNSNLLMVAGKNRCLMSYRFTSSGHWKPEMLQKGNTDLGSQEILNDMDGLKKKSTNSERISSSGSDASVNSRDRFFPNRDSKSLCKESSLVDCYWIDDVGLVTVESNATIKLWSEEMKLVSVLNGRQSDVRIHCSAFEKNVLVICDNYNLSFQIFKLIKTNQVQLETIQEFKLNTKISSCALTGDGNILALGLCSGDVVVWNVHSKRQMKLLKHHKSRVQWCCFSPLPDRLGSSVQSPSVLSSPPTFEDDDQPPLVLVTMASEIVWWNITYIIRMIRGKGYLRTGLNVISPLASPLDTRNDVPQTDSNTSSCNNFFFGNTLLDPKICWRINWKNKTYKEGSKRKEILACIKLSGMSAHQICVDEKFSYFVTVDNPGHVHIMKLMNTT